MPTPYKPWEERIADKWHEDDNGCHIWTAHTCERGYGRITNGQLAHRVNYAHRYGPLPTWLFCCHTCDVTSCINPDHLYLGTHEQNMRDFSRSGIRKGEGNPHAKLTEQSVREIRKLAGTGESFASISRLYGVGPTQVSRIVGRQRWGHI